MIINRDLIICIYISYLHGQVQYRFSSQLDMECLARAIDDGYDMLHRLTGQPIIHHRIGQLCKINVSFFYM